MTSELVLEVKRQLFHLILGVCISIAVWVLTPLWGNLILIPLLAAVLVLLAAPRVIPHLGVSKHLIFHFERKHDAERFPFKGAIFYGVGIIPPIVLLPVELACTVILILSVGDSVSTLAGKFYGRHRIWKKSIEGTLGFMLSSLVACLVFIRSIGFADLNQTVVFLVLAGALIEFQEVVDDNLAIPIGLTIILKVFGF